MLANYLIGLREGLEAALVVGILVAYLIKSGRRRHLPQLWAGTAIATLVSLVFGAVLTFGPQGLAPGTQEAIAGSLAVAAVGLITWMIFWMGKTARYLKSNLQHKLDETLAAGPMAVLVVALLAVGREGLETALFLWAAAKTTGSGTRPLLGAALGLATALVLGWLIYRGALRLNLRSFFAWTGAVLIVIAAGVLASGVNDLQDAGILPGAQSLAFDVSATIPPESWYANVLKGVLNFSPATTWLQAIAWAGYLVPVLALFARTVWFPAPGAKTAATVSLAPALAGEPGRH
jgi:high-affinity iron transporter